MLLGFSFGLASLGFTVNGLLMEEGIASLSISGGEEVGWNTDLEDVSKGEAVEFCVVGSFLTTSVV